MKFIELISVQFIELGSLQLLTTDPTSVPSRAESKHHLPLAVAGELDIMIDSECAALRTGVGSGSLKFVVNP